MSIFDKNPNIFRVLFGILLSYALILSGVTFYRFGRSPTDENLFKTPPSNLFLLDPIRGAPTDSDRNTTPDTGVIPPYNLITEVDGTETKSLSELQNIINSPSLPRTIEVRSHLLKQDEARAFRVQTSDLKVARIKELPPTAYVVDVARDGASDRAGMKVGDLIFRINGLTFPNIVVADSILRSGQTGKQLAYDVLRDEEQLTLHVTLASFGFPFPLLVVVLSGVVFIAVGSFIAFKRPLIKAARLLGMLCLTQGYFLTNMLIRRDVALGGFALYVFLTLVVCVAFTFPLYIHSMIHFPHEHTVSGRKRWILPVAYAIALLFCIATVLFDAVGFFVSLAISIACVISSAITFRNGRSAEQKALSKPLRRMGILAWIGASCLWTYLFIGGVGVFQYIGYVGIPLLLIPASYVYVIARHRLLDLDLRIRRSLQYNVIATLWIAGMIVLSVWLLTRLSGWEPEPPNIRLTGGSIEIVDEPMSAQQRGTTQNVILVASALIVSVALWKTGRYGLEYVAGKFHRTRYDYRRAARELTEVMSTRLNMTSLAQGIVERLAELMQLKRVGIIFFRDQKTCCCEEFFGFDGRAWREYCMRTGQRLADAIHRFKGEFRVDYLPDDVKKEFRNHEFEHIIPIYSKEKLVGTLLVGEKRSESTFQHEDLEFLSAVARQASVAIENAFLYEELAEQERMKHELEIARKIQLESLPQETPKVKGLDIAGVSIPAMEVGGDYYDYLNGAEDRVTVIVGDVSGKGTSAALYMSKIQGIFRSLNTFGLSPRELFTRTNQLLWNDLERKSFVTAFGAAFNQEERRVVLARAGHLPLFQFRSTSGDVVRVTPKGMGMGLSGNGAFAAELEERSLTLNSGDIFLLVTDGITEGKDLQQEEFGEDRLMQVLQRSAQASALEIRDCVTSAVREFAAEAPQHDDQTVVVVKVV